MDNTQNHIDAFDIKKLCILSFSVDFRLIH